MQAAPGIRSFSAAPLLPLERNSISRETYMFIWLVIIGMTVVGGFWVKTRRMRKAKENTYVPN